jgi:hypothetical protein
MRTDYLRYDASSLQEYLRRKLLESGLYTDQIYPGSDTRLLIDLFAWTFDVLTYILNNNLSNALFEDTEVYENLNKIVKVLSYKPRAYTTSHAEFSLYCDLEDTSINTTYTIPKFSIIRSGRSDKNGKTITYAFTEDYTFEIKNGVSKITSFPVLYNGEFTKYTFESTAQSIPYETFIMNNISTNVDNDHIHIFTEKINEAGSTVFTEIPIVDNLVMDASSSDLFCELRLNEDKEFVVKFGNGIHGKKLDIGTKVHAIYLESNGADGVIDSNELTTNEIMIAIKNCSSQTDVIELCYGGLNSFNLRYEGLFSKNSMPIFSTNKISLSNRTNSSEVKDYEDIEDIKENAPSTFRLGNRLVTSSDYRTYILNNFSNRVSDVFVCNNNEYCSIFYKWLDQYKALNSNIRLLNYKWTSACDFNNVYIWLKPNAGSTLSDSDKNVIVKKCNNIKDCTVNIVPCTGVELNIIPYTKNHEDVKNGFNIKDATLDSSFVSPAYFLIKKGRTYIQDDRIISTIADIICKFFESKDKFGEVINLSELNDQIMNLGYIESIKTVNDSGNSPHQTSYVNGLSFAAFTPSIIGCDDFEVFTQYIPLERFQYAKLLNPDKIKNLIKITSDNVYSIKNNEF